MEKTNHIHGAKAPAYNSPVAWPLGHEKSKHNRGAKAPAYNSPVAWPLGHGKTNRHHSKTLFSNDFHSLTGLLYCLQ
ncbi:hypothetical protein AB6T38_11720 [Aliiglaciecola sp. SL4]|uniref:hypothetical protein n=1 Tax=Aliiglaciecola sp. SL4 TaxID=3239806 RepID=UPI00355C4C45